jgi:hypothetical protein
MNTLKNFSAGPSLLSSMPFGNGIEVGSAQEAVVKAWRVKETPGGTMMLGLRARPANGKSVVFSAMRVPPLVVDGYIHAEGYLDVALYLDETPRKVWAFLTGDRDTREYMDAEYFRTSDCPGWAWAVLREAKARYPDYF